MSSWLRIGKTADIPHLEGRTTSVGGRRIAIFNTGAGFLAVDANCPHEGGPLADGIVSDTCVTCPLHGWRIDLRTGAVVGGGAGRVAVHEVAVEGRDLYLRSAAAQAA